MWLPWPTNLLTLATYFQCTPSRNSAHSSSSPSHLPVHCSVGAVHFDLLDYRRDEYTGITEQAPLQILKLSNRPIRKIPCSVFYPATPNNSDSHTRNCYFHLIFPLNHFTHFLSSALIHPLLLRHTNNNTVSPFNFKTRAHIFISTRTFLNSVFCWCLKLVFQLLLTLVLLPLTCIRTNSVLHAALKCSDQAYPVIVLSHGFGSSRCFHTFFCEHLVRTTNSIVISIDHIGSSLLANNSIHTITHCTQPKFISLIGNVPSDQYFQVARSELFSVANGHVQNYSQDIVFLIHTFSALNLNQYNNNRKLKFKNFLFPSESARSALQGLFHDRMNFQHLSLIGHSQGGANVIQASNYLLNAHTQNSSVKLVNLMLIDPWMFPVESSILEQGLCGGKRNRTQTDEVEKNSLNLLLLKSRDFISIPHFSFTDNFTLLDNFVAQCTSSSIGHVDQHYLSEAAHSSFSEVILFLPRTISVYFNLFLPQQQTTPLQLHRHFHTLCSDFLLRFQPLVQAKQHSNKSDSNAHASQSASNGNSNSNSVEECTVRLKNSKSQRNQYLSSPKKVSFCVTEYLLVLCCVGVILYHYLASTPQPDWPSLQSVLQDWNRGTLTYYDPARFLHNFKTFDFWFDLSICSPSVVQTQVIFLTTCFMFVWVTMWTKQLILPSLFLWSAVSLWGVLWVGYTLIYQTVYCMFNEEAVLSPVHGSNHCLNWFSLSNNALAVSTSYIDTLCVRLVVVLFVWVEGWRTRIPNKYLIPLILASLTEAGLATFPIFFFWWYYFYFHYNFNVRFASRSHNNNIQLNSIPAIQLLPIHNLHIQLTPRVSCSLSINFGVVYAVVAFVLPLIQWYYWLILFDYHLDHSCWLTGFLTYFLNNGYSYWTIMVPLTQFFFWLHFSVLSEKLQFPAQTNPFIMLILCLYNLHYAAGGIGAYIAYREYRVLSNSKSRIDAAYSSSSTRLAINFSTKDNEKYEQFFNAVEIIRYVWGSLMVNFILACVMISVHYLYHPVHPSAHYFFFLLVHAYYSYSLHAFFTSPSNSLKKVSWRSTYWPWFVVLLGVNYKFFYADLVTWPQHSSIRIER